MAEISINSLSKTYKPGLFKKKIPAVRGLTFDVCKGEVFGLIGPNGAGKSTTIRMLLGLLRPDSGTVMLRGHELRHAAIRQEIGYLPENPYLYDHLTLLELLTFSGQTSGLDVATIAMRGEALMGKLNLLDARKRPLRTFSKGMMQRAGICFALLHDPAIIVLDEPMSGLDPIGRKMVFDLVMELKQQAKTIVFCSHILNDVERLCDRISLMSNGRLVKQFERKDFLQNLGNTIILQTSVLTPDQQNVMESMGVIIRAEEGGHVLAISEDKYFTVNQYLQKWQVRIQGGRSEWMTLEKLFMQFVGQHKATTQPSSMPCVGGSLAGRE